MQIFINGESHACPERTTLEQLVVQLGMKGDRVAIELNREIVPRTAWNDAQLNEGDRLEIVHFVGGGVASQGG